MNSPWKKEELEILLTQYEKEGPSTLSKKINRSIGAIKEKAMRLGLRRKKFWTKNEDFLIIELYPTKGINCLDGKNVNNRTGQSIVQRAIVLNVRKNGHGPRRVWTKEEDAIIIRHYKNAFLEKFRIPRLNNRSANSVSSRARSLGLKIRNNKKWTKEEDALLIESYHKEGPSKRLCSILKVSRGAIAARAYAHGLKIDYEKNRSLYSFWRGFGEMDGSYWRNLRKGASLRNLTWTISKKFVWELFISQNRKCKLSGIDLDFSKYKNGKRGTASLDRIDSSKGYTKNNVQWVHKDLNRMKWNLPDHEFINYCKLVAAHSST